MELFWIVVGIIVTLIFKEQLIPFFETNVFRKKHVLNVRIQRMLKVAGLDDQYSTYTLGLENMSTKKVVEEVYLSVDFPFVINYSGISADQRVVYPQLTKGSSPKAYQNNKIIPLPTNHVNLSALRLGEGGLFGLDVIVDRAPSVAIAPFSGLNAKKSKGCVWYSYYVFGSRVNRQFEFDVPSLEEVLDTKEAGF